MDRVVGRADVQRWRRNVRDEVDGAAIYPAMADSEPSAELAQIGVGDWVLAAGIHRGRSSLRRAGVLVVRLLISLLA